MELLKCCQFIGQRFCISSRNYCLILCPSWPQLPKASIRWVKISHQLVVAFLAQNKSSISEFFSTIGLLGY